LLPRETASPRETAAAAGPVPADLPEQVDLSCVTGFDMKIQSENQKKVLQNRLRRIEGQVRGIASMLEEERECGEILQQLSAVRSAIQGTTRIFLEQMVNDCLLGEERDTEKKQQAAKELLELVARK
jgi:CsoR family transcriptional regulator, copper-sensing transcriptional repressor